MRKLENRKIGKLENWKIGKSENRKIGSFKLSKFLSFKFPSFKLSKFPIFKPSSPRRSAVRGAVMMEYVIVAVLIAAACALAVVVFSRTTARGTGVAARAATLNHTEAAERQRDNQKATEEENQKAKDYHDLMHD